MLMASALWVQPVRERVLSGNKVGPAGLRFSSNGDELTITSHDRTGQRTLVFDTRTGLVIAQPIGAPAGELGKLVRLLGGREPAQWGFSRNGCTAVTAPSGPASRSELWDVCKGQALATLLGDAFGFGEAEFNADETRIMTVDRGKIRIYPVGSSRPLHSVLVAGEVAAVSKDFARIAVWGEVGLAIFDPRTGHRVATIAHGEDRAAARFSSDGRWLVTFSEFTRARLWDARTGRPVRTLGDKNVSFAATAPDRPLAALVIGDGTVELWRLR